MEGACSTRYYLYDDPTPPGRWDANLKVVSRELGVKLARHYDGRPILSVEHRPQLSGFFFVASAPVAPGVLEAAFPGFETRPILGRVVQLRRVSGSR